MSGAIEETREKWLCPHGCGILIDSPCRDEPRERTTDAERYGMARRSGMSEKGAKRYVEQKHAGDEPRETLSPEQLRKLAEPRASILPRDEPRETLKDKMQRNYSSDYPASDDARSAYGSVDLERYIEARSRVLGLLTRESTPVIAAVLAEVTQQTNSWRYEQNLLTQQIMLAADHIRAALRLSKEGGA